MCGQSASLFLPVSFCYIPITSLSCFLSLYLPCLPTPFSPPSPASLSWPVSPSSVHGFSPQTVCCLLSASSIPGLSQTPSPPWLPGPSSHLLSSSEAPSATVFMPLRPWGPTAPPHPVPTSSPLQTLRTSAWTI